jgi:hypothetical protein
MLGRFSRGLLNVAVAEPVRMMVGRELEDLPQKVPVS